MARADDQPAVEITPVKDLADRLVKSAIPRSVRTEGQWTVHECDTEPSVAVEKYRGFRIVLRRTWKEFTSVGQRAESKAELEARDAPFEWRQEDWEFVLIPVRPEKAPAAIATKMKWRQGTSPWHTRDVCLGEGFGYVWFTRGTLYGQEQVRDILKLEGGDDRLQLAMDGLLVKDLGTMTGNSCLYIPAKFGDRALPYVERTIAEARDEDDLWRVVGCLAFIQTERSTELLLALVDDAKESIRNAAEYALIHEPFRKAAKRVYLDMLRRQSSIDSACRACIEFQWNDAVPILREQIAAPRHLRDFETMIRARRTLEGQPIAQELLGAEQTLRGLSNRNRDAELEKKINSARQLLIQTDDAEAANIAALSLATATSKGGAAAVNEAGAAILKSRPRQATLAFLKSLAAAIHETDRPRVAKLLDAVSNADAPGDP
jgi:hypothetical protein